MEKEQQKLPKSVLNIPGTIVSNQNSQLLISSGIPSIDEILGGGFPVGTVVLLEEDESGSYANIISKYFIAEGVVSKHSLFLASYDISTKNIVQDLPAVNEVDPQPDEKKPANEEKMKIAFRYHYLPTTEKPKVSVFGHYYDLTKTMPADILADADILHWKALRNFKGCGLFINGPYYDVLLNINQTIRGGQFSVKDTPRQRSVLRVLLSGLGSPMWNSTYNTTGEEEGQDLKQFLYCLRALVRSAFAVAFVTLPSHLIKKSVMQRCIHSSDIAFKLQSFAGTNLENNPALSEYHGFFHINKFAAINSFISKHPGSVEYTFKLKRKKFCIEKLHLPPDMEIVETNQTPTMSCGSNSGKHLLDF